MALNDRRCDHTWVNKHGDSVRCMLDADHPAARRHQHGIQIDFSSDDTVEIQK